MTPRRCIVGIGQQAAGDDGVGLLVVEELRRRGVESSAELHCISDASDLVTLLQEQVRVVLVDAVLGTPPGRVTKLLPESLAHIAMNPASSHGMGVLQAIELSRALSGGGASPDIRLVAVTIDRPDRYRVGLSPDVAAAVSDAADCALELLEMDHA